MVMDCYKVINKYEKKGKQVSLFDTLQEAEQYAEAELRYWKSNAVDSDSVTLEDFKIKKLTPINR